MDLAAVRNILVVKLSSLGDIVHVTPCLRALRRHCPRARIVMAVERPCAPLLRKNPHVDLLIEADADVRGWWPRLLDTRRGLSRHVAPRFDLAVDFQGRWKSALWVYLSRARVQGGRGGVRPGWQCVVQPNLERHAVQVCGEIAERLGVVVHDLEPEIFLEQRADAEVTAKLAQADLGPAGFVLINPFSRWVSKEWPLERYAELMRRLALKQPFPLVVVGGRDRLSDEARLLKLLKPGTAVSFVGQLSLEQAMCLYRRARLMVTGDSGPMHIAAALRTPVIALFGPTLPELTGPWGQGHIVIQKKRPLHRHVYREDKQRAHIAAIDVAEVYLAVRRLLDQKPEAA